jgi:hypothetical protein
MEEYAVHHIVAHKMVRGELRYKIRWVGYSAKEDTWQRPDDLNCDKLLKAYWKQRGKSQPDLPSNPARPRTGSRASRKSASDVSLPQILSPDPEPPPPVPEPEVPVHEGTPPRSAYPRPESPLRSPSPRPESPLRSPFPRPESPLRSPSPLPASPSLSPSPRPESRLQSTPPQEWPEQNNAEDADDHIQRIKDEGPRQVFSVCRYEDELWYRVLFNDGQSRWIRSQLLILAAANLIIDFLHTRFEEHYMGQA